MAIPKLGDVRSLPMLVAASEKFADGIPNHSSRSGRFLGESIEKSSEAVRYAHSKTPYEASPLRDRPLVMGTNPI